jgi:hypothetical protein
MTFQGHAASSGGRRHRLNQPSETREPRKAPQSTVILMADGTTISRDAFQNLHSTAPQKFRGSHRGCADSVRKAIPEREWTVISEWITANPLPFGSEIAQADGLVAILIAHAAGMRKQNTACLFDEIVEKRTAAMLLPAN